MPQYCFWWPGQGSAAHVISRDPAQKPSAAGDNVKFGFRTCEAGEGVQP
jgi:hypothetical protein